MNEVKVRALLETIRQSVDRPMALMEVCGGQTHAIAALGLEELLPDKLRLIHGPGCPVCVTSLGLIDRAVRLAGQQNVILCTYGDMLRVPGSTGDLLGAKARGGDVRLVYSPMDAVALARATPGKAVVFFAVGFETTAPATALALEQARALNVDNFFVLCAHVQVPPVLEWLMDQEDGKPDGLLAPGHVCAITGTGDYVPLSSRYGVPMVVTGFEAEDLLQGIAQCVQLLNEGRDVVENAYARCVKAEGNSTALAHMRRVFEVEDRVWRGMGIIPRGGLRLREEWRAMDAGHVFPDSPGATGAEPSSGCRAGEVLRGVLSPKDCPFFNAECTPMSPMGAPMVSGEGACAACFRYQRK